MISENYNKTSVAVCQKIMVSSPAFLDHHRIPVKYTGDGLNVIPPLKFSGIPLNAKSFAIIFEDKDSMLKKVYWVAWNIPVKHLIHHKNFQGIIGRNYFNQNLYTGPKHPRGIHRYSFKVFALNKMLTLSSRSGRDELLKAICNSIVGMGEITVKYNRKRAFDVY